MVGARGASPQMRVFELSYVVPKFSMFLRVTARSMPTTGRVMFAINERAERMGLWLRKVSDASFDAFPLTVSLDDPSPCLLPRLPFPSLHHRPWPGLGCLFLLPGSPTYRALPSATQTACGKATALKATLCRCAMARRCQF